MKFIQLFGVCKYFREDNPRSELRGQPCGFFYFINDSDRQAFVDQHSKDFDFDLFVGEFATGETNPRRIVC